MNAPLRVGIAGLGRLGWRHAEVLAQRTRGCELVAACSPVALERERAAQAFGLTRVHADVDALLADPALDAVVLATPTPGHPEQTSAALAAGKHVFVEKPLAMTVEACEHVEAVAREHPDRIVMVGFVRRFDTSYRHAAQEIEAGRIGRPFLVRSQTCDKLDASGAFLRFAPTSGGIFMDCSVHDIDIARWLLGRPKALRAFATGTVAVHAPLAEFGDVDNGLGFIEFDGGARAVCYASRTFAHGHEPSTEVIGTGGKLLVGHGAVLDRLELSDSEGTHRRSVPDFLERFGAAFEAELQAFVDACRGEAPSPLPISDATEATRIALALTRSLRSGMPEPVSR